MNAAKFVFPLRRACAPAIVQVCRTTDMPIGNHHRDGGGVGHEHRDDAHHEHVGERQAVRLSADSAQREERRARTRCASPCFSMAYPISTVPMIQKKIGWP